MMQEQLNKLIAQIEPFYKRHYNNDTEAVSFEIKSLLRRNNIDVEDVEVDGEVIFDAVVRPFITVWHNDNSEYSYDVYLLIIHDNDFFWMKDEYRGLVINHEGKQSEEDTKLVSRHKVNFEDIPTSGYELC